MSVTKPHTFFFFFSLNRNLPMSILGTRAPKGLTETQESSLRWHAFHMPHASCLLRKAIREELAIQVSNLSFFLTEHIFLHPDRHLPSNHYQSHQHYKHYYLPTSPLGMVCFFPLGASKNNCSLAPVLTCKSFP